MKNLWSLTSVVIMVSLLAAAQTAGGVQPEDGLQSPMSEDRPQPGAEGYPMGSDRQQQDAAGGGEQGRPESVDGKEMLGKNVQNLQGREFGRVVALATRDGETAYIIMTRIGGGEGELTPIPFDAAYFDPQKDAVVLTTDMDDSWISQAPSFMLDEMEKLGDPEFERRVHGYFGEGPGLGESSGQGLPSKESERRGGM